MVESSFSSLKLTTPVVKNDTLPAKASRNDGWKNILTGAGTSRDKRRYTSFDVSTMISKDQLAHMYMGDGIVASIIDIFADDMTREWGYVENDPVNEQNAGTILTEMDRLDARTAFNTAGKWARLFGGALIFVGAMDGRAPDQPLDMTRIKNIEFLKVFDLGDILTYNCIFDEDVKSPTYGSILKYSVQMRSGQKWDQIFIHASRCIPFFGKKIPFSTTGAASLPETRYWGMSEIQPIWDYIKDHQNAFGSVSNILLELIIGKYTFQDMDEMLATGNEEKFKIRVEAIDMTKSVLHSVLLGEGDSYERDTANLSGISDVLDRYMMNLAAVTRYPVTKLFGRSPAGMNATGENDLKNYYDSVHTKQNAWTPFVQHLVDMIAAMKKIKTPVFFKWNPLFQLSEKDLIEVKRIEAEVFRTEADAYERYMNRGVLLPEDVYGLKFEKELGKRDFANMPDLIGRESMPSEETPSEPKKKKEPKE